MLAFDRRAWAHLGLYVACGFATAACADLTKVAEPDVVTPSQNDNPAGALDRRAAAIVDFSNGFSLQVVYSGLIADELTQSASSGLIGDQRTNMLASTSGSSYPYDVLSLARVDVSRAIPSLRQYAPTPAWHIGEMYAYRGFVGVFFAENMCSGVPTANVVNGTSQYGPTLTRSQLIQRALADFDSAASNNGSNDSVAHLAAVGRGRALIDSGDFANAATAVASVPDGFAYGVYFEGSIGSTFEPNQVYQYSFVDQFITVSDHEGQNGLPFLTQGDARTAVISTGNGLEIGAADSSATAPLVLASGTEAELIRAEASLFGGNVADWSARLNALRAAFPDTSLSAHPLPADSTTEADPALRLAVMFRERAYWLFLSGHRQGDLRRLIRQYGLPTEGVFPTGLYQGGPATYGTAVAYVPFGEQFDPNFHGCLSLSP